MRLLLTGVTGFIGGHTLTRFIGTGVPISVIARAEADPSQYNPIRDAGDWIVSDLTDPSSIRKDRSRLESVTHVVHIAGYIPKRRGEDIPLADVLSANVVSLTGLVERLPLSCEYFCYLSTVDVYGQALVLPVKETHPLRPETSYGASKATAESISRIFASRRGLALGILRLSHVYGPGESHSGKMIPAFIQQALRGHPLELLGDGSATRDYLYIQDAVDAIQLAVQNKAEGTFNIATGIPIRVRDVAEMISRSIQGTRISMIPTDQKLYSSYFDINNAHHTFGFTPHMDFSEGLAREIEWFKKLES